jgi:hypothetical protein
MSASVVEKSWGSFQPSDGERFGGQKLFTGRGSTFSQFIYSLRLDHAARLLHRRALLGTRQPLSEIAYVRLS